MDKLITKRSLIKEILYVFLFFNLFLVLGFIILHLFNVSTKDNLTCYTFVNKFERADCSFAKFTLQASIGYLFIIIPLEVIAALGLAVTAALRKMLDKKIKKLSDTKSIIITTTIFFVTWIALVILWFYSMVHKNI